MISPFIFIHPPEEDEEQFYERFPIDGESFFMVFEKSD
jgi:hypothetical protein